ncbi:EAL domain-containing protein [Uliginosibacterium sp. H1]|uniref:EAL domain-containing protein n=1 Tax=Uliginosibacterium sp. H1 TaxID=3114757 RepID=UPI002E1782F9|nr:EAL domain-containing protein [Uliginosibacterium sp. H1]
MPTRRAGSETPDDPFLFADESDDSQLGNVRGSTAPPWRVLITDDDEEVHRATAFALRGVEVDGRPLELLHAHSAIEAESVLRSVPGVAVAMLDVVMETPHAGLGLVETIRDQIGLRTLRIVLRTGQPGYAPELEVIRRYDINDYRTKSELTQTRLITTLTAAIRAYAQLESIEASNRGLADVAHSANSLFRIRSAREYARSLLERIAQMMGVTAHGVVCVEPPSTPDPIDAGLQVLHAAGRFAPLIGASLDKVGEGEMQRVVRRCLAAKTCVFDDATFAMCLGGGTRDAVAYFDVGRPITELEKRLLSLFAASLAVGFENVDLIERLDFFAFFDPLTHLPNRTRFLADVDQDLFARQGGQRCLAIADVVRFSDINDALGHRCGDTLLIAVAKRLRAAAGSGVTMARIAGDAFGLYGPEGAIDPTAIRRAFEAPFFVHGHALAVQVRLGIVRVADTKGGAVELLRNANLALNQARMAGGGAHSMFSREMSDDVQTRVSLLHSLRAAIDFRRGLSVNYQPQVNATTGELVGVEALLRWRNDYGEMVTPDRFIPLAERTGMIHELGLWVIEMALDRLAAWRRLGLDKLDLSINISPVQFRAEDFSRRVRQMIAYADVPAERLVFEITESVGLEDHDMVLGHLNELREMGVRFAVDDFGTGFSSLSQLARLPATCLKIDRSFVQSVVGDPADRAIAATIISLARNRSLGVVAEGVETEEQQQVLLDLGCEVMQGYYLARPMTVEQFDEWVKGRSAQ